jgi:MATE family multidrug resistance protein
MPSAPPGGRNAFLESADVKRILYLAVPAQLALLTQTGVNLVDTYLIGLLEEPERSAGQAMLSFSLALLWAVGGFLSAVSVGTQAMVARRMGRLDPQASGMVLANAIVVACVASSIATLLTYPLVPKVFALVSNDPAYVELGSSYTQWRFVGVISMVVTAAYKAFFDGTGRTYAHFGAAIVMNIVNVTLCMLLMFGNWGFPKMGVEGAGLAAAVSSWVGLFVMVGWSFLPTERKRYRTYRKRLLSRAAMWQIAKLSVPSGVATTVVMTGFILFIGIVGLFDREHVAAGGGESIYGAATTIIINVLSLTFFSCMAFGVATATLVSSSLGAKKPDEAERYAWSSVKIGAIAFGVMGLFEIAYPEAWIRFFNDSPAVIAAGAPSMRLMGACGPLIATGMILTQALFGAGNPRFVMLVELALHFGVLLPLAYLLGVKLDLQLFGVWSSAAIYVAALTVIMVLKFRGGSWKSIDI